MAYERSSSRLRNACALVAASCAFVALTAATGAAPTAAVTSAQLQRGRYLVAYGGCNECHTPGWQENDGAIPVARWMTGSTTGFRGPWGDRISHERSTVVSRKYRSRLAAFRADTRRPSADEMDGSARIIGLGPASDIPLHSRVGPGRAAVPAGRPPGQATALSLYRVDAPPGCCNRCAIGDLIAC